MAEVGGGQFGGGEVALDVVDGAGEDVEVVVQLVEGRLGDDELAVAERQFVGALAGDPVPLAAAGRAELAGATAALSRPGALAGTTGIAAIPS